MKNRSAIVLCAVAMMLTASLAFGQGTTTAAGTAKAKVAKPAAAAVTKGKAAVGAAATTAKATTAAATTTARTTAATTTTAATKGAAAAKPAAAAAASALVDLNSASKADLMKLPGIGEAISAKIIAGRPWANKAQLLSKGLVSKPVYDKLSALVIAKQAK